MIFHVNVNGEIYINRKVTLSFIVRLESRPLGFLGLRLKRITLAFLLMIRLKSGLTLSFCRCLAEICEAELRKSV